MRGVLTKVQNVALSALQDQSSKQGAQSVLLPRVLQVQPLLGAPPAVEAEWTST